MWISVHMVEGRGKRMMDAIGVIILATGSFLTGLLCGVTVKLMAAGDAEKGEEKDGDTGSIRETDENI